jgi:DNA-binding transcriptional ArsR family regulator
MTNHSAVLTALGDPTRRAIFERIAVGTGVAVGELARDFPVSRPAVSQHLKVLKEAGLVRDQPDGSRRIYTVDQAGLASIRAYFDQFWRASLASYRDAANRSHRRQQ